VGMIIVFFPAERADGRGRWGKMVREGAGREDHKGNLEDKQQCGKHLLNAVMCKHPSLCFSSQLTRDALVPLGKSRPRLLVKS